MRFGHQTKRQHRQFPRQCDLRRLHRGHPVGARSPGSAQRAARGRHGAQDRPGATCAAAAVYDSSESRFCAVAAAAGTPIPNCANAQANNLTIVETTFQPASTPGCFGKGNCVWYDISIIPSTCTDTLWKLNQCAGTGGASYNLPGPIDVSEPAHLHLSGTDEHALRAGELSEQLRQSEFPGRPFRPSFRRPISSRCFIRPRMRISRTPAALAAIF